MRVKQQEKFDALVEGIERYARQQPNYYKLRVALLAALGYAYILFVFLLLFGMVWALREAVVYTNSKDLIHHLNWIAFLLGLGIVRLFWANFPPPEGIELNRKQVPQLFALVDELTAALKAPKFHHILLTDELNAAVLQRPRFGFLGWQQNYLLLGLPLMQALSIEQFRAVVAHELGHLSGNHSRFSSWIYRVRKIWFEVAQNYQNKEQGGFFLFNSFFNWYEPFFSAYTFVLARANEYEADRCAAELAGVQNKAEALINIQINGYFLYETFWPRIYKQAATQPEPPDGIVTKLLGELSTGVAWEDAAKSLDLALAEKTDNDDTHPCLSERLSALGYQGNADQVPAKVKESAAGHFFGDTLESFAVQLDENWKKEIAKTWKRQHTRTQQQKRNLKALEAKAQNHALTVEETWKRAYLTWHLKGKEDAIPLFQEVLAQEPEHPLANYQLGKILLQKNDAWGISHMQKAIERDPELVISGCELLYLFYKQLGQLEEAEMYRQRGQQHCEAWKRSLQERTSVSSEARFIPHNLPEVEVRQIAEQLSGIPEVRKAYLVCKEVILFPEKPFYVLAITRRFVNGQGPNYKRDNELIDQLEIELNFSGTVRVLLLQENNTKLRKALRQVRGASIYN
ncbi:MAG: M48 family metalloprotease [Xenococcaceae cyanobacterium]